jgi:hypothetical protein
MESEVKHPKHEAFVIVTDGNEYKVHRHVMSVPEILELAGKSPGEWVLEAEPIGGDRATFGGEDDEVKLHEGGIALFHTRRREHRHHHHHHDEKCELTVVANSVPVQVKVHGSTPLTTVVDEALREAKTIGREDDQSVSR